MKKRIFILSVLLINNAFGQSLDLARAEFDKFEYQKSASMFAKLNTDKALSAIDLSKLAYSQYVNGDFESCLVTVDELIDRKAEESMHYLMRADALKATGKFQEAKDAYALYLTKDPSDNVQVDVASCDYLVNAPIITGATAQSLANNSRKADSRYMDTGMGMIFFHEIGVDSAKTALSFGPSDAAELMLMRPFVRVNNEDQLISFPNQFSESSITSFTKDPNSNKVVFTAVELLSSNALKRAPHLYVGEWNNGKIESAKLWNYSEMESGGSTAFGCFTPNGKGMIFTCIKPGSTTYSDFYFSSFNGSDWSEPVLVSGINTVGFESYPMFVGETFSFSTTGRPGCGALDAYYGKFDANGTTVSEITNFPQPINSFSDDYWAQLNSDTSFVTSNRFGSNAEDDVWMIIDPRNDDAAAREQARLDSIYSAQLDVIVEAWNPKNIYFNFETDLPNTDYSFLNRLAEILSDHPTIFVDVIGYTDVRGTDEINVALSIARANFVISELEKRGIPADRMHAVGKGALNAKQNSTDTSSEVVHQSNRVVVIKLIKN